MNDRLRVRTIYLLIGANVALLLILLATLGYVQNLRSQVTDTAAKSRSGCSRNNLVRAAVNYGDSVQQAFLAQAARTREEQAAHDEDQGDPVSAKINGDAAKGYRALITGFVPLKIVDCEAIYP